LVIKLSAIVSAKSSEPPLGRGLPGGARTRPRQGFHGLSIMANGLIHG